MAPLSADVRPPGAGATYTEGAPTRISATPICDAVTTSGKLPGFEALKLIIAGLPASIVRLIPKPINSTPTVPFEITRRRTRSFLSL